MPVLSMRECSSARLLIRPRDLGDAAPAGIRRSLLRGAAPFICSLGSHSGRVVALRTSDRYAMKCPTWPANWQLVSYSLSRRQERVAIHFVQNSCPSHCAA